MKLICWQASYEAWVQEIELKALKPNMELVNGEATRIETVDVSNYKAVSSIESNNAIDNLSI